MDMLIKATIKDQIYAIIKHKILSQQYKLGEKINMLTLAQELSVSNTPIREALSMLAREGLVVFTPNAGPRVVTFDQAMFHRIVDSIKVLLLGGYAICVEKKRIDALISLMGKKLSFQQTLVRENADDYEFAKASIAFDVSILDSLQNETLYSLYTSVFDMLFLIVLYDHQHCDVDRLANIREHEIILDAIKKNDHEAVQSAILMHFGRFVDFSK